MQANIRVFMSTRSGSHGGGWEEIANFSCENPILPRKGDGYRGPGYRQLSVTKIEHEYVNRPIDHGGAIDMILIYVE